MRGGEAELEGVEDARFPAGVLADEGVRASSSSVMRRIPRDPSISMRRTPAARPRAPPRGPHPPPPPNATARRAPCRTSRGSSPAPLDGDAQGPEGGGLRAADEEPDPIAPVGSSYARISASTPGEGGMGRPASSGGREIRAGLGSRRVGGLLNWTMTMSPVRRRAEEADDVRVDEPPLLGPELGGAAHGSPARARRRERRSRPCGREAGRRCARRRVGGPRTGMSA